MKTMLSSLICILLAPCFNANAQPVSLALNTPGIASQPSDPLSALAGNSGFVNKSGDRVAPKNSYFLDIQAGMSSLYNKDIYKSDSWDPKSDVGYQFHVGYLRRFEALNYMLSCGVGVGISSYGMKLTSNDTIIKDDITGQIDKSTDKESFKEYTAKMKYFGISENTRLTYLDIPVFVEFGNESTNKIGFFVKVGLKLSFNISSGFEGEGNYIQTGYYEEYNIELPALPGLFVFDDQLYSGSKNYSVNPINVSAAVSGGITIPLTRRWILTFGPTYETGLTGINSSSDKSDTDYWSNFNHLLETSSGNTFTRAIGLEIGIHNIRSIF